MSLILVVDDDPLFRRPVVKLLERAGHEVITAENAFEAMGAAKKCRPDLILLDVMIPPMDGLTFLMLLRDEPQGRNVPVVLLTGLSDAQTVARAQGLGVKEHLVKSEFTPEILVASVARYTGGLGDDDNGGAAGASGGQVKG